MLLETTMDSSKCHIVYVTSSVSQDQTLKRYATPDGLLEAAGQGHGVANVKENLIALLEFNDVHVCATGTSCIKKLFQLHDTSLLDLKPTIVLVDTPHDERIPEPRPRSRSTSPHSRSPPPDAEVETPDEVEIYGLKLLQRIVTEAHLHSLSKLVVPVSIINRTAELNVEPNAEPNVDKKYDVAPTDSRPQSSPDQRLVRRCVDLGAVDVVIGPMNTRCVMGLEVHAYKAHKDAAREQQSLLEVRRGRKLSWVGVSEEKPFGYLREAMVSGLMKGICRSGNDSDDRIGNAQILVSRERKLAVSAAVAKWHFCAHDFSDDELLVAAMMMFRHALRMPELEKWRLPNDQLINFLVACRAAYNNFVPYHNFRHVIDVLQATFNFLTHIGTLPPYLPSSSMAAGAPAQEPWVKPTRSPMASLLEPFEGLTLLITAIGHDVGHPGVNNGFLVTLNAPLAQLYNDRSVLESFHCAAYSQILRRYWPAAFEDTRMRNLMISSILATDMGLHFEYMRKLGDIQDKLQVSNTTDGWDGRMMEEQRALACSLLIKCADISNVARKHATAVQWMHILSDEFSRQASMEEELEIQSSLLAPPKRDLITLSTAQLGFMNMFALPLFQGVADIMPNMQYTVDELDINKTIFEMGIRDAKARASEEPQGRSLVRDGTFSPRTMTLVPGAENNPSPSPQATPVVTPAVLSDGEASAEKEFSVSPTTPASKPAQVPSLPGEYKEVNGAVAQQAPAAAASSSAMVFDPVVDFANSDPFNAHRYRLDSFGDGKPMHPGKQRCSETTDGSNSVPYSGDWASQATSATTSKMPLSPSTQGTSIVSRDSMDRPSSVPRPVSAAGLGGGEPSQPVLAPAPSSSAATAVGGAGGADGAVEGPADDDSTSNGSIGKAEGTTLKKKSSRFRMNAITGIFRRNKTGTSPVASTADAVGS